MAQPGAIDVLDRLPPDRVAIVTSGTVRLASARIAAAGLPRPAVVVTADDVEVGKPNPAPFLTGAALLGFPPERCLVVEDAPAGVTAAKAAGCPVVGVLTTHDALDAPTVTSLDRIDFQVGDGGSGSPSRVSPAEPGNQLPPRPSRRCPAVPTAAQRGRPIRRKCLGPG